MISLKENFIYILQDEVAIEDFDENSLLMLCMQRRMLELNSSARRIILLLDGKRNLNKVKEKYILGLNVGKKKAESDLRRIIKKLMSEGAIKCVAEKRIKKEELMGDYSYYSANPDVTTRVTNGVTILNDINIRSKLIVNYTGLMIWDFIKSRPKTKRQITEYLWRRCTNVPECQIDKDVQLFLFALEKKNFLRKIN